MCWHKFKMNSRFYSSSISRRKAAQLLMIMIAFQIISCNIINPAEPIPAYVHIDSISLSTTSLQGSSSNKIVDAWVYVDGSLIGTYEMPVTCPVLSSGSHKLTIRPGVLVDGVAATRTIYPFYTGYDTVVNFESQKIITPVPKVTYSAAAHLSHIEDFDQAGTNIVKVPGSDTTIIDTLITNRLEGKC